MAAGVGNQPLFEGRSNGLTNPSPELRQLKADLPEGGLFKGAKAVATWDRASVLRQLQGEVENQPLFKGAKAAAELRQLKSEGQVVPLFKGAIPSAELRRLKSDLPQASLFHRVKAVISW